MSQLWFQDKKGGVLVISFFRRGKPKGKMFSLKCNQCGSGFLSSYDLKAPICRKCLQKAKSLDSTIDYDKICTKCGKNGVIYGKRQCHSCYFGLRRTRGFLRGYCRYGLALLRFSRCYSRRFPTLSPCPQVLEYYSQFP